MALSSVGGREIKIQNLRDGTPFKELIEVKRVYQHPHYKFGLLYNDIAMIELGRRIAYDYEKYGDSPVCIDQVQGKDHNGSTALGQGYGTTEFQTEGTLLETNVTIITIEKC